MRVVALTLALLVAGGAGLSACGRATETAGGGAEDCPPEREATSDGDNAEVDPALEQLVQDQADAVGGRFGGSSLEPDGTVTFRLTDGPVPQELRDKPKVRVVTVRFSTDRLDEAMDVVAERLNRLLAPENKPMSNGAWPWDAAVSVEKNAAAVRVDRSQRPRHAEIRAALADELRTGTVQMCYGQVPVATPL